MLTEKGVHFLAIEGVIGAGKTSLARIIAERWNGLCIEENFDENPFLISDFFRQIIKFHRSLSIICIMVKFVFLVF